MTMKTFNLSLIIPVYKRYENVCDMLSLLEKSDVRFNSINLVLDKINHNEVTIEELSRIYHFKNDLLNNFEGITVFKNETHKGMKGLAEIFDVVGVSDEENCIFLEDDLVINVRFLEQCQEFFDSVYCNTSPVFIGYSKTNQHEDKFFQTYNPIPMWGWAVKGGEFKKYTSFYNEVQSSTQEQKRKIIEEVINKKFSCEVFERYKAQQSEINIDHFLNRPNNCDVAFMVYMLRNNKKFVKNCECNVKNVENDRFATNKKSNYENPEIANPIEMDILNAIHLWG